MIAVTRLLVCISLSIALVSFQKPGAGLDIIKTATGSVSGAISKDGKADEEVV